MASENNFPINEEENEKASSRNPQDTELGNPHDTKNKEAGETEAWQHAYEASTPSFELNVDAGIETEKQTESGEEDKGNKSQE